MVCLTFKTSHNILSNNNTDTKAEFLLRDSHSRTTSGFRVYQQGLTQPQRKRLYKPTPLETISSDLLSKGDFGALSKAPNGPSLTFETPYSISSNSTDVEGGAIHSSPLGPLGVAGPTITFQTPYSDSSSEKEEYPSTQVGTDTMYGGR